jgi:glycosyltransferase involved in cell wall biosynthesis
VQLFSSLGLGGMERQTLQIAGALKASGRWDVHVAALACQGPLGAELRELGFPDTPCFPVRSLYGANTARQVVRLARMLRRRRVRILHAHDLYTNLIGITAARLAGVPVRIASRREVDVFTARQRRVERIAYRWASAVVANCEFLRTQLVEEGVPATKALLLPNAVLPARVECATPEEPARLRQELGIPVSAPVIVMLANLYNTRKDLTGFVRAASAVTGSHPEAVFVLAGGGDPEGVHRIAAQCHPRPTLLTPGAFPQVAALLAASEVCVLASFSEGAPNAVLEAMAAARPVVATAVGGIPELVQDGITGWLVRPGDIDALGQRVVELLEDPRRAREMGERGRLAVLGRFSIEQQVATVEDIYHRLMAGGGKGPE